MAPKNKARQQPGNMRSRQQAKLNSQRAQKSPIEPAPRTSPRRQIAGSTQGGTRVGNSSEPWGQRPVRQTTVREVGKPQLPSGSANKALPPGKPGGDMVVRPRPSGNFKAPNIPKAASNVAKAVSESGATKALKIAGKGLGFAGELAAAANQAKDVFNPKDNLVTRMSDLGTSIENAVAGGRKDTYTNNDANAKRNAAVKADNLKRGYSDLSTAKNPPSRFAGARDQNLSRIKSDPQYAAPKPAASNGGSASKGSPSIGSSSAPSRGTASRPAASSSSKPSTPAPTQSKNMDENYAAWATANQGLAAKVKKGQAGYEAVQKALDKLKIKGKK